MPEEFCSWCEELAWQCTCPPEPDEVINPTPDDYYDEPEPEGMGFEDSMCLKYPERTSDPGYGGHTGYHGEWD